MIVLELKKLAHQKHEIQAYVLVFLESYQENITVPMCTGINQK